MGKYYTDEMRELINLCEDSPKGWEGTVKAMKKHKDIDNPYALAHWMKNKGYKSHRGPRGGKLDEHVDNQENNDYTPVRIEEEEDSMRDSYEFAEDVLQYIPEEPTSDDLREGIKRYVHENRIPLDEYDETEVLDILSDRCGVLGEYTIDNEDDILAEDLRELTRGMEDIAVEELDYLDIDPDME